MVGAATVQSFTPNVVSRSKSTIANAYVSEVYEFINVVHVLVVDDASLGRKMVSRILTSIGCTVTEAADGTECLNVLEEKGSQIDLVCMDYEMPSTYCSIDFALQIYFF